jgi:hypothetical protein
MRSLHPPQIRIAIICDNFSPHLSARKDKRVGQWAAASNAGIACTPTNSSWMNRLECQFTAWREFAGPACAASSNGQPQPDKAPATE